MNKIKEYINKQKLDNKTIKEVRKLQKITLDEINKSGIEDIPLIIIRHILKKIFNKITFDELYEVSEKIVEKVKIIYNKEIDLEELQKVLKTIVIKFKKNFKLKKHKYIDFINNINFELDNSILLTDENNAMDNWFLANGLTKHHLTFISTLQKTINNIENINILITINNEVIIYKVAPVENIADKVSEFSTVEILIHINSKLDEIKKEKIKENDTINSIIVLSDKEVIEFKQNEIKKEISELVLLTELEDNFYNKKDFLNIEDEEKEIIKNIINIILIYLKSKHENSKDLIYEIFDGFKIENKAIKLYFKADRTQKRHIRKITESEDFKQFNSILSENIDYKTYINYK